MLFVSLLFWGFLASYVIHILDEALLNGGFVKWIADNFWPTYRMRMFFWFNAAFIERSQSATFSLTASTATGSFCH